MAKLFILLAGMVCVSVPSQAVIVHTVCPSGCDFTDPQSAENSLPATLNDTYVFEWQAGQVFTETLTIANVNANGYWVIHRSSNAGALAPGVRVTTNANMATIQNPVGGSPVIGTQQGASYHRFEGLEIMANPNLANEPYFIINFAYQLPGSPGDSDNQRSDLPHHIVFDRCYIHNWVDPNNGNILLAAILANTGYFEVDNSTIMVYNVGLESHAISAFNDIGPFYYTNNMFQTLVIGTIFGGAQPTISGARANGVFVYGNYYWHPWLWRVLAGTTNPSSPCEYDVSGGESYNQQTTGHWWLCVNGTWTDQGAGVSPLPTISNSGSPYNQESLDKNQVEFKNAWGMVVDGNMIQNAWEPAMLGQHGSGLLLNQVDDTYPLYPTFGNPYEASATVRHLLFENNWMDSVHGIEIGVIGTYNWNMDDIQVRNNLGTNMLLPDTVQCCYLQGTLFYANKMGTYTLDHNTMLSNNPVSSSSSGYVAMAVVQYPPGLFEYTNNIMTYGTGGHVGGINNQTAGDPPPNGCCTGDAPSGVPYMFPNRNVGWDVVINDQQCAYGTYDCAVMEFTDPPGNPNPAPPGSPAFCASCLFNTAFTNVFSNYPGGIYTVKPPYQGAAEFGRDPGADIQVVDWSAGPAVSGAPNSYLNFRVRALTVTAASVSFVYTAPDTNPCTLTVANNSTYTAPVYNAGDGGGNPDRSVTFSGLSGESRYWWQLACGTSGYQRYGTLTTP